MKSGLMRILVVDEDGQRGEALGDVLRATGFDVVIAPTGYHHLPNLVQDTQPDVVLVDVDSPGRDTLEQLAMVHRSSPRPVVMFAKDNDEQTIQSAVKAGVSAYRVDGIASASVRSVIDVAIAHFRLYQSMREELEKARTTLDERKYVDRAKAFLMKRRGLSEVEAYGMLRKLAMDRKQRIGDLAKTLLEAANLMEGVNS
ncbi:MAG: ANTAR domain-containing protein [Planctomycetota bacterium]